MLARLSILFVQGEAVRHPQELANPAGSQLLARGEQSFWLGGEQSDPRTAENAPQNQSFGKLIGRKRFTLSALSSGEVSKGGGTFHIIMNPNS